MNYKHETCTDYVVLFFLFKKGLWPWHWPSAWPFCLETNPKVLKKENDLVRFGNQLDISQASWTINSYKIFHSFWVLTKILVFCHILLFDQNSIFVDVEDQEIESFNLIFSCEFGILSTWRIKINILGVIIVKDCKNNQQAEKSINQANIALGRMRKTLKLNFLM